MMLLKKRSISRKVAKDAKKKVMNDE